MSLLYLPILTFLPSFSPLASTENKLPSYYHHCLSFLELKFLSTCFSTKLLLLLKYPISLMLPVHSYNSLPYKNVCYIRSDEPHPYPVRSFTYPTERVRTTEVQRVIVYRVLGAPRSLFCVAWKSVFAVDVSVFVLTFSPLSLCLPPPAVASRLLHFIIFLF